MRGYESQVTDYPELQLVVVEERPRVEELRDKLTELSILPAMVVWPTKKGQAN